MPYKNIEDRRAAVMRAYHRLRQRLIDLKGGTCSDCGKRFTESFQEIHHTAEDGKNKRRSKSRYKEYRRLLDHPEEYELLCRHPCHKRVTMRYVASFRKGGSRRAPEDAMVEGGAGVPYAVGRERAGAGRADGADRSCSEGTAG